MLMNHFLVMTFPEQFSRAQTPIIYQVTPPSGAPGKKSPIKIGAITDPFARAIANSSLQMGALYKWDHWASSLMLF